MKKYILLLAMSLLIITVRASTKKTLQADTIPRINEISWVITEVIDGGFMLRYERALGEHLSFGISGTGKGDKGLIRLSGIDSEKLKTGDIFYSGVKIVPEMRYYINKTQQNKLDGFYFGFYAKYANYVSDLNGTYISSSEKNYRIDSRARLKIFSAGLGVGYKLPLAKRWHMDFMIAGPGVSKHNYSIKHNLDIPDEFYDDLEEALEKYSLLDFINSDIRFDIKDARTKFTTPTFRYGLSIGYTF